MSASTDQDLLAALAVAEKQNPHKDGCAVCIMLTGMSDPLRQAAQAALAGTIGRDKLITILRNHGHEVSRRSIERHRREAHTP